MSGDPRTSSTPPDRVHEYARSLASESIVDDLNAENEAWLRGHLAACPECSAVADEYQVIHQELRSLQAPEPPRDLWARTSAALDAIDGRSSSGRRTNTPARRAGNRPLFGTVFAVGFVVLVAGASLIAQSPIVSIVPKSPPTNQLAIATGSVAIASQGPQAPLAVVNGTSYWIASDQGLYQIKGSSADCVQASGSCTVGGDSGQTLGSIQSDTTVSAVLAPDASQAAVWTGDKIAIVPLATTPQTVSMDLLTPRPTLVATPTPTPTPTPTATATARVTASATARSASPLPTTASTAAISPPASGFPAVTPSALPKQTATVQPPATATPTVPGGTAVTKPTAILDGYEIVGRDPEFSSDGSLVAFTARPVDHSTGPDLFIWRSGQEQAHAVTTGHSDLFAGWFDGKILVGEIAAGDSSGAPTGGTDSVSTTSYLFDPADGGWQRIDRPMLIAGVDPTGTYLVYWSGSVEFDTVSGLWQPGKGDLYVDRWAALKVTAVSLGSKASASPTASAESFATLSPSPTVPATASPTATPTLQSSQPAIQGSSQPNASASASKSPEPTQPVTAQPLQIAGGPASVRRWSVRWDAAGQNVAVWVAEAGSVKIGRLNVFAIDRTTGQPSSTMAADEVLPNIGFYATNLVYTSALDGKTYIKPVPVLPPSPVVTAAPPTPGTVASSGGPSTVPAPATDRPGA